MDLHLLWNKGRMKALMGQIFNVFWCIGIKEYIRSKHLKDKYNGYKEFER